MRSSPSPLAVLPVHAANADWARVAEALGNPDAATLAKGLRAALDKVNVAGS